MIFTVTSINKNLDLYEVISDTNEKRLVTANQIWSVMMNGYEFTNAFLTKKGFGIKANNRTKYIQIPMNRETQMLVIQKLEAMRIAEEQKKEQMTKAIKHVGVGVRPKVSAGKVAISGNTGRNKSITYKGNTYLSVESLCRHFGQDANTFKQLYNIGYSLDECLGLVPLRPESEVTPRAKMNKMIDAVSAQRGE